MDDGIPRLANMPRRRKKAPLPCAKRIGLLLPRCLKHSLPPRPHGWIFAEVSYEQLSAISRAAAVTAPNEYGHTKWCKAEYAAEAAHEAHTSPHQETAYFERIHPKVEDPKSALRVGFAVLLEARAENLGAPSIPSWRYPRAMAAPHPHP
ncbi:hypothetical protein TcBrA4_0081360 [Trypanosoma cruzi]|nr:hypothetical protein TcBrA4_0081360 [Trypanosoma cruzi]